MSISLQWMMTIFLPRHLGNVSRDLHFSDFVEVAEAETNMSLLIKMCAGVVLKIQGASDKMNTMPGKTNSHISVHV